MPPLPLLGLSQGIELDLADDGNLVIISRILPGSVTAENGMLSEGDQVGEEKGEREAGGEEGGREGERKRRRLA